jgi:tRNA 2-thiouridine synthesizing protein E
LISIKVASRPFVLGSLQHLRSEEVATVRIRIFIKATGEPVKRANLTLVPDGSSTPLRTLTDRSGWAAFDLAPTSGKVLVEGIPRFQGRIEGELNIGLWSPLTSGGVEAQGAPGGSHQGSVAYASMQTRGLRVAGRDILTDSEGYLVDLSEWSEDFVRAQAEVEALPLAAEHWEVIRFLRDHFEQHGIQAQVRDIIRHFRQVWGQERGNNHYLHRLFPRGGPQKQGNRLAGLLRTKGEH